MDKAPKGNSMVGVQIPGMEPGNIPADKVADFFKKYPKAKKLQ